MATLLDSIHRRLKGEPSEHTKEIDKQFEPIIEKIDQIKNQEQEDEEDNNKEGIANEHSK